MRDAAYLGWFDTHACGSLPMLPLMVAVLAAVPDHPFPWLADMARLEPSSQGWCDESLVGTTKCTQINGVGPNEISFWQQAAPLYYQLWVPYTVGLNIKLTLAVAATSGHLCMCSGPWRTNASVPVDVFAPTSKFVRIPPDDAHAQCPTASPTASPTQFPTPMPTQSPTPSPGATDAPTAEPTAEPTVSPTSAPTQGIECAVNNPVHDAILSGTITGIANTQANFPLSTYEGKSFGTFNLSTVTSANVTHVHELQPDFQFRTCVLYLRQYWYPNFQNEHPDETFTGSLFVGFNDTLSIINRSSGVDVDGVYCFMYNQADFVYKPNDGSANYVDPPVHWFACVCTTSNCTDVFLDHNLTALWETLGKSQSDPNALLHWHNELDLSDIIDEETVYMPQVVPIPAPFALPTTTINVTIDFDDPFTLSYLRGGNTAGNFNTAGQSACQQVLPEGWTATCTCGDPTYSFNGAPLPYVVGCNLGQNCSYNLSSVPINGSSCYGVCLKLIDQSDSSFTGHPCTAAALIPPTSAPTSAPTASPTASPTLPTPETPEPVECDTPPQVYTGETSLLCFCFGYNFTRAPANPLGFFWKGSQLGTCSEACGSAECLGAFAVAESMDVLSVVMETDSIRFNARCRCSNSSGPDTNASIAGSGISCNRVCGNESTVQSIKFVSESNGVASPPPQPVCKNAAINTTLDGLEVTSITCNSSWCHALNSVLNVTPPLEAASIDTALFDNATRRLLTESTVCICRERPTYWFGGPAYVRIPYLQTTYANTTCPWMSNTAIHTLVTDGYLEGDVCSFNFTRFVSDASAIPRSFHEIDSPTHTSGWLWAGATMHTPPVLVGNHDEVVVDIDLTDDDFRINRTPFLPDRCEESELQCTSIATTAHDTVGDPAVCLWQCVRFWSQTPNQVTWDRTGDAPVWLQFQTANDSLVEPTATLDCMQAGVNYVGINTAWLPFVYGLAGNRNTTFVPWRDAKLDLLEYYIEPRPVISCGGVFAPRCRPRLEYHPNTESYLAAMRINVSSFVDTTFTNATNFNTIDTDITDHLVHIINVTIGRVLAARLNQTGDAFLFPVMGMFCNNCTAAANMTVDPTEIADIIDTLVIDLTKYISTYSEDTQNQQTQYACEVEGGQNLVGSYSISLNTTFDAYINLAFSQQWVNESLEISQFAETSSCHCTSRTYAAECAKVDRSIPCSSVPLCEPCSGRTTTTTTLPPIPDLTFSPTPGPKHIASAKQLEVAVGITGGIAVVILALLIVVSIRMYRRTPNSIYDEETVPLIVP